MFNTLSHPGKKSEMFYERINLDKGLLAVKNIALIKKKLIQPSWPKGYINLDLDDIKLHIKGKIENILF